MYITEKTGFLWLTPIALPTTIKVLKMLSLTMVGTTLKGQNHLGICAPTQPEKEATKEKHCIRHTLPGLFTFNSTINHCCTD